MTKNYKNLVFTTHALERLKDRSLSQDSIYKTLQNPDFKKEMGRDKTKFFRTLNKRKVQVVASYLNEERKWLIISVWVRGEENKQPLVWRMLTLPFRIVWWFSKKIFLK